MKSSLNDLLPPTFKENQYLHKVGNPIPKHRMTLQRTVMKSEGDKNDEWL